MRIRSLISMSILLGVAVVMAHIHDAKSTSFSDRPLAELYDTAQWLLSGRIESLRSECNGSRCIYKADVLVTEKIKGSPAGATIRICSVNALEAQEKYFIFAVPARSEDTFGVQCDYLALRDGIVKTDDDTTYYRYMSPNGRGRLIPFEHATYRTSEIEDPEFSGMLKKWRSLRP